MVFKKIRNMKVYEQSGYRYKSTPTIMLKGQWLKELRFEYGTPICVECSGGKLVITRADEIEATFTEIDREPVMYVAEGASEYERRSVQRDVVRTGVVTISVSFSVTQKWLRLLTEYKQQKKIRVGFFDPETASVRQTEMYVEGFKATLRKDASYKGLWIVSFTLKEL